MLSTQIFYVNGFGSKDVHAAVIEDGAGLLAPLVEWLSHQMSKAPLKANLCVWPGYRQRRP